MQRSSSPDPAAISVERAELARQVPTALDRPTIAIASATSRAARMAAASRSTGILVPVSVTTSVSRTARVNGSQTADSIAELAPVHSTSSRQRATTAVTHSAAAALPMAPAMQAHLTRPVGPAVRSAMSAPMTRAAASTKRARVRRPSHQSARPARQSAAPRASIWRRTRRTAARAGMTARLAAGGGAANVRVALAVAARSVRRRSTSRHAA